MARLVEMAKKYCTCSTIDALAMEREEKVLVLRTGTQIDLQEMDRENGERQPTVVVL